MALDLEVVVDGGMGGKEPLRRARRSKSAPLTESADPRGIRDAIFCENIVFGSLSVDLAAMPAAIAPRLPLASSEAIIEDGEPNLMSALRWEYGLTISLRGRQADLDCVLGCAEGGGKLLSCAKARFGAYGSQPPPRRRRGETAP